MALITRVSRLFRADLHAVLDRIEEPDVLLRQAVREMEDDLGRDEQRLKRLTREHAELVAREAELTRSIAELDEQLDVCFGSAKDDLARAVVRRKLELERFGKVIARRRQGAEETLATLRVRTAENRVRLEGMRQQAEVLAEEAPRVLADDGRAAPDPAVRDEDVEVAFLRERQRRGRP